MISKIIKDFFLKRKVNRKLANYQLQMSEDKIVSIGVLIDANYFSNQEALISEIEAQGIKRENIEILSFVNKNKKTLLEKFDYFFRKDITLGGLFKSERVTNFINKNFDLLISYYDVQNPTLLLVTKGSKAKFKVGFHTIDKRIHHLSINTIVENYSEFISELFKYLKILKKI
ncbi:DUF6913 domain-containing protein [Flavobacterium difficile]|uniref:Uncharacterized protein n=1 Tax=Flavobacterium difficile TaxID=2709659 RepID=A0ABX0IB16_9FLAO|nr:hypothetical protein [Flavobacterium difficile]NHM02635.1 hypothetical protein [Flavobacterium difficile]